MDPAERVGFLKRLAVHRALYLLAFAVMMGGGILGGRHALSDILIMRVLLGLFWVGIPALIHTALVWGLFPQTMRSRSARIASALTAITLFGGMAYLPGNMPAPDGPAMAIIGGFWGMMMYTPSHMRELEEEFAQRRRELGIPPEFNGG